MYCGGQLRDISEVSEVGVTIIQQFRHLDPSTHLLSSSPSVDHAGTGDLLSKHAPGILQKHLEQFFKILVFDQYGA